MNFELFWNLRIQRGKSNFFLKQTLVTWGVKSRTACQETNFHFDPHLLHPSPQWPACSLGKSKKIFAVNSSFHFISFLKNKKKTVFKEGNSQDSAFHRILAYIGPDRLESTISKITGKISVVIYCLLFLDNNLLCWKIVNFLLIILINNQLLPT